LTINKYTLMLSDSEQFNHFASTVFAFFEVVFKVAIFTFRMPMM